MQRLLNIILLFKEYFVVALLIVVSLTLLSFNDQESYNKVFFKKKYDVQ
jgi:hypothetical protein